MKNICQYRHIISKGSRLLHYNFGYCKFNNSTNKYMTNEILECNESMQ